VTARLTSLLYEAAYSARFGLELIADDHQHPEIVLDKGDDIPGGCCASFTVKSKGHNLLVLVGPVDDILP